MDTEDVMIKEDGNGFFEMRRMKAGVGGVTVEKHRPFAVVVDGMF